jgi:hypothetical protein
MVFEAADYLAVDDNPSLERLHEVSTILAV